MSYVGGGAVAVRSTPSPPFGYVRVRGMFLPGGSVTPISAPYDRQSNTPLQSHLNPYHAAYFVVHFVANHLVFAKEVLVYLDASLQEVWIFAELQICLIRRAVSKIPVSFERLPNMERFNILLALLERPWLWNVCSSPEGHLVWIVQNFKTLPARFAKRIPRSIPLTTIVEHLRSCYWDGLRCC